MLSTYALHLAFVMSALTLASQVQGESQEEIRMDRTKESIEEEDHPLSAPVFTKSNPSMHLLPKGDRLRLKCKASGNPIPQIAWYYNGQDISEASYSRRPTKPEIGRHSLRIDRVKGSDSGNYTCVAANALGLVRHTTVVEVMHRPIVKSPPIIVSSAKNHTAQKGSNVSLQCAIMDMSNSIPNIQWVKHFKVNGSWIDPVKNTYHYTLLQDSTDLEVDQPEVFTITDLAEGDEGWYTCIATNKYGTRSSSRWVTIEPGLTMDEGQFQRRVLRLLGEIRDHLLADEN